MKQFLAVLLSLFAMGLMAETITIDGSTTVGPIAKAFAEYYMGKNPGVNITVSESGSGNGAKSLINGTCDIADMSREMKPEEISSAKTKGVNPTKHVIAMDGIELIIHPTNPVKNLSVEQLRKIFSGEITNWKAVGGPDKPIVVISRDTNSGTYETFETKVMKGQKMGTGVEYVGSNGNVKQRVQTTIGAIGYVGLGFVDKNVKAVTVNGIRATKTTILSKTYPIARELYMYTDGLPARGSNMDKFLRLCKTPEGKAIIEKIGFIALNK